MDIKQTLDRGDGVFYPNIYVNDIPLQGKTLDEAAAQAFSVHHGQGVVGESGGPGIDGLGAAQKMGADGLDDIAPHEQKHTLADDGKRQAVQVVISLRQAQVAAQHGDKFCLVRADAIVNFLSPHAGGFDHFAHVQPGTQLHLLILLQGHDKTRIQPLQGIAQRHGGV